MPATLATVSNILKEIYEPKIREQLYSETTALKRIQKTSEGVAQDVGGKYVTFPVHISRNTGIGARLENEALPTAGNQGTAAARVGLRYLYGSVRMTGPVMKLAKTNPQAFTSALELELNGVKDDLSVDLNRQIYGNGQGIVATINNSATSTTMTVKHSIWLQDQMIVDIYDTTGVTQKASGRTVSAITATGFTYSGSAVALVTGDIVVRTGSVGTATLSTQREWTGLQAIVNTASVNSGTLYNLTNTTLWVSTVDGNSGTNRALSEGLITTNVDGVRQKGGKTSVLLTTLGVRRAYANLLVQQRKFTNTQEFKGGFSGLAFTTDQGDIPMVIDTFCPPNTLYGLQEDQLKWYREEDWSFMDLDGAMWSRVAGYDAYDATLFQYSELGTHRRNAHFRMEDITEN